MKTVTGRVISAEPISLSKAATILSGFVSSENGASQDVSAYLRRAAAAFTELKSIHREIKSCSSKGKKPRSEAMNELNRTDEFEELDRAKETDDLVGNGVEIRIRKSEIVREEESICGVEQDEIKEGKKSRKKKSRKNKEEDVVDEKVKEEKLEDEQRNEEKKERRKKKKNNNKEEDVVDEKVNEKLEDEQRNEERKKEKKKKRKSDGETGSDERKSKKKRKSKEIDG